MVERKLLQSIPGPKGGLTLLRAPKDISILDVASVFENVEENLNECAIGWAKCSDENPCALHNRFKPVREKIKAYMVTASVKDFF